MPQKIPHDVALRATLRAIVLDAVSLGAASESYGFAEYRAAVVALERRAYLAADVPVARLRRRRSAPLPPPPRASGKGKP
jgi:hypothetical protein